MKHFRITAGRWPKASGQIEQKVTETVQATRVALMGFDALHLRPKFDTEEGALIGAGQPIFHDRKHPDIAYVAPISGRVVEMSYGPRRTLSACVIAAERDAPKGTAQPLPDGSTKESIRLALLKSGFWSAFRTRPFGLTPDPQARPAAIFVNAVQGSSISPDPAVVLSDQQDAFRVGLATVRHLTDGSCFLCQSQRDPLCEGLDGVVPVSFSGSPATGLASTQIDLLCPVGLDRSVWTIGYQDVAAIGHLFQSGEYVADRVISVSGSGAARPKLVRAPLGIDLADLCPKTSEPIRMISGDIHLGREGRFLGRFDEQATFEQRHERSHDSNWMSRLFDTSNAIVPTAGLETALALRIPPVPLMRALSIGDSEAAQRLGCLSLVEEDVAALTRHCTSGADYGQLLRHVLDELLAEAA